MNLNIREATKADARSMAALRAASIRALCEPDHHGDEAAIKRWVGADDKFEQLLARDDLTLIAVELDDQLAGLGAMSGDRVTLNYVHPDFRFRGVSKAIMQTLESRMVAHGVLRGVLDSSVTALRFYQAIGWKKDGPADPESGQQPMSKDLL